ncbi:hypothetical protein QEJ31_07935 [Pigmentibacter sp. JX0631]|uniref:hypothetical protein n=1 Tax=Pigmentibacter sp. JX0631 TaxID=2976982 RepID=UPI002468649D|nr:hypothetical protein [Pigmentibacter sp. JX0631]WGL61519.1 hypothetical protein QEJ31_07935 [Pigmentibacter sp. JX0631]
MFLKNSIEHGFSSIILPYSGYFQVLPQILSYFSYKITIEYYPYITLIECSALFSFALHIIMKNEFLWITQNKIISLIISISFLFLPGQTDFLGNFANLHSVLFLCCVLLLFYDLNKKYSLRHFLFFLFAGLSAGELCTILPLLMIRIYLIKKQHLIDFKNKIKQHLILLNIVIFSTLINSYAYITNSHDVWTQGEAGLEAKIEFVRQFFPNRFLYSIFNRMFLIPIFGDQYTFYLNQVWQTVLWLGFAFTVLFSYFVYKTWSKNQYLIIFSGIFTYIILILMTCLVRKGTWNTGWFGLINEPSLFNSRYLFLLIPVSIISIYTILFRFLNKKLQSKYAYAIIFILFLNFIFQNRYNFFTLPFDNNSSIELWNNTAKEIKYYQETKTTGQVQVSQGKSKFVIVIKN